jgi:hypothetical protein
VGGNAGDSGESIRAAPYNSRLTYATMRAKFQHAPIFLLSDWAPSLDVAADVCPLAWATKWARLKLAHSKLLIGKVIDLHS